MPHAWPDAEPTEVQLAGAGQAAVLTGAEQHSGGIIAVDAGEVILGRVENCDLVTDERSFAAPSPRPVGTTSIGEYAKEP